MVGSFEKKLLAAYGLAASTVFRFLIFLLQLLSLFQKFKKCIYMPLKFTYILLVEAQDYM
jgi:hypothetical protein